MRKTLLLLLLVLFMRPAMAQQQYSNIPTLYVTTDNNVAITSKEIWLPGSVVIVSNDSTEQLNEPMQIRGRGNSTWNMPKKPYRMKLDDKHNLLNLPARERDWVLLPNYADKTLIRNAVAFKISEEVGMAFSPSVAFVDVVVNGSFRGNYMVTDQIEAGPMRVNVRKMSTTDTTEPFVTGGYLLELDGFADREVKWFSTNMGMRVSIKEPDPDDINDDQMNYIINYMSRFEAALFSVDFKDPVLGYRALVDTTSLINWYIASELTGNSDAFWSTYIYKHHSDDKLYFGPLWDYDIAFNNDSRLGDATRKLMSQAAHNNRTWINQFLLDEWFQDAVWRRWQELVDNQIESKLLSYIDELTEELDASQQLNFNLWKNLNNKVYLEQFLFSTYQGGVDYLKSYITSRVSFLNEALHYIMPEEPTDVFKPGETYYRIINKRSNNALDVAFDQPAVNAQLVMWVPISDDENQLWEIKEITTGTFQILNKTTGLAATGNGRGNNLILKNPSLTDYTQRWKITPVLTGGLYGIENVSSGLTVNNAGGSTANGTKAIEWDNNIAGSQNQQWFMQQADVILSNIAVTANDALERVKLYPNPAREQFFVDLPDVLSGEWKVEVMDLSGRIVLSQRYSGHGIPTATMGRGMYLVRLSGPSGEELTRKLMVQ